jgi:hypothetical protein
MLGMRREIAKFPTVSERQAGGVLGLAPIPTRLGPTAALVAPAALRPSGGIAITRAAFGPVGA